MTIIYNHKNSFNEWDVNLLNWVMLGHFEKLSRQEDFFIKFKFLMNTCTLK